MNLNDEAIRIWLEKYNGLEKTHDKKWDRMLKYEAAGDDGKASRISKRMDEIDAKMEGMREALEIFGYTVICQDGVNKVVVLDREHRQRAAERLAAIVGIIDATL